MVEVRCKGCGLLLGEFQGMGQIKCRKCGGNNSFNTDTGEHSYKSGIKRTTMKERATSSGLVFH